jgi:hypothetical protein
MTSAQRLAVFQSKLSANLIARGELIGSVVLVVIGLAFIALAPAKQTDEQVSAAVSCASTPGNRQIDATRNAAKLPRGQNTS